MDRTANDGPAAILVITISNPTDKPLTTSQMPPSTPPGAIVVSDRQKSDPVSTVQAAVSPPQKTTTPAMTMNIDSLTTTTITTSSTSTTPSASISAEGRATWSNKSQTEKRRLSSECLDGRGTVSRDSESDQLFWVRQLVATRSKTFAQNLDAVLTRARDSDRQAGHWLQDKIRNCQCDGSS